MTTPADLSPIGALLPQTKHAVFPPADQLDGIGLTELADAIRAHTQAQHNLHAATTRYAQAEPGGSAWRAAVVEVGEAVAAGDDDPGRAVRNLLDEKPARIADAVAAANVTNLAYTQVLIQAQAADASFAERALDQWCEQAARDVRDGARRSDRIRLARVEEQQTALYPRLRATWAWLASDGVDPYRPTPAGVDRRLADAIIEHGEQLIQVMSSRGLFSQSAR